MAVIFSLITLFFTVVSQSLMDLFGTVFILVTFYQIYNDKALPISWKTILKSKYFIFFYFWVLWILISFLVGAATYERLVSRVLEFRWILYVFSFFYILLQYQIKHFTYFILALTIMCILSWHPYVLGVSYISGFPHSKEFARAGGFLNDPMTFAHGIGLFLIFFLGYFSRAQWLKNKMVVFSLFVLLAALLLTITRGVWIAVTVAATFYFVVKSRKHAFAFLSAVVIFVALGYVTSKPLRARIDQTISFDKSYDSERLVLWQANWYIFKNNPIFGIGYGENKHRIREFYDILNVPAGQFEGNAHNQYINFLSGTGVVGLLFYLIWIGMNLYWAFNLSRNQQASLQEQALGFGSFLGQIVLVIGGLTESNFEHSKLKTIFALFWAISFYGYYMRKIRPLQKSS